MSPEAPGNLVVLDVRADSSGYSCRVERFDPTTDSSILRVSWNAISRPPGYEPVAGGAAYVEVPPGFEKRVYEARPDAVGSRLGWFDKVFGDGLMLVVVLPYGHAVPSYHDTDPHPVAAKVHDGRMALYWLLAERTRTTWRVERAAASEIAALCVALNEGAAHQDRRSRPTPVSLVNHAAVGHYPPGLQPDEELRRFHELCAWIGEHGGDDAQISFTGILLTFLCADDPISSWFRTYVQDRPVNVADMLGSKGFGSREELEKLARTHTPSGATSHKPPWTPSAREVLTSSDALAQRVGGARSAVGIRHVMGAYCVFHFPNHERQLREWGFDLPEWAAEYQSMLRGTDLSPGERAGWHALFDEMGVAPKAPRRPPPDIPPSGAAEPAGWDVFIAHSAADRTSAEQLYDRLEAGGHRAFLDSRSLAPGDFWDLEIPRALRTSRVIVVLLSSGYEDAYYLRAEISQAIDRARKVGSPRVVPVYLDGKATHSDVPYGLGVVQDIDALTVGGLGAVAAGLERLLA